MESRSTGAGGEAGAADEHAQTGLLEYRRVVVVGVPHRPAGRVLHGVAAARARVVVAAVGATTVSVRQVLERVVLVRRQLMNDTMQRTDAFAYSLYPLDTIGSCGPRLSLARPLFG